MFSWESFTQHSSASYKLFPVKILLFKSTLIDMRLQVPFDTKCCWGRPSAELVNMKLVILSHTSLITFHDDDGGDDDE